MLQSGIGAQVSTMILDGWSYQNVEVGTRRELFFGVCPKLVLLNYCSKNERKFHG
jgi:hypothetical protein